MYYDPRDGFVHYHQTSRYTSTMNAWSWLAKWTVPDKYRPPHTEFHYDCIWNGSRIMVSVRFNYGTNQDDYMTNASSMPAGLYCYNFCWLPKGPL
jgi:hypothetical protein